MSKRNGDRSRAHKEQKKKLLRRKRSQELRQGLQIKALAPAAPNSGPVETTPAQ